MRRRPMFVGYGQRGKASGVVQIATIARTAKTAKTAKTMVGGSVPVIQAA
jgi:hypothetical protein